MTGVGAYPHRHLRRLHGGCDHIDPDSYDVIWIDLVAERLRSRPVVE
jgi:hypothetical protein